METKFRITKTENKKKKQNKIKTRLGRRTFFFFSVQEILSQSLLSWVMEKIFTRQIAYFIHGLFPYFQEEYLCLVLKESEPSTLLPLVYRGLMSSPSRLVLRNTNIFLLKKKRRKFESKKDNFNLV